MSRAVWKFKVFGTATEIKVDASAVVRHVGFAQDSLSVWLEVDPDARQDQKRTYHVFCTGHKINRAFETPISFVGSVITPSGVFVYHIYEEV